MASLWDKLTGKAPMVDPDEDEIRKGADSEVKHGAENNLTGSKKSKIDKESLSIIGKWAIPIGCCFVVMIGVNIFSTNMNKAARVEISQQDAKMVEYRNSIDTLTNQYKDMQAIDETYREMSTSADEDTSADDNVASEFFKHFATWSNGKDYDDLRAEAQKDYGYTDTDTFMQVFLPAQGEYFNRDTDGHYDYQIDYQNLNMTFESISTYKLPAVNTEAITSYAGIVTVSTKDTSDTGFSANTNHQVFVKYDIKDGKISNVQASLLVE